MNEVSLVDKAANNKRFILTKRADDTMADDTETKPEIDAEAITKAVDAAVTEAVSKALAKAEADKAEAIAKAVEAANAVSAAEKAAVEKRLADEVEAKEVREAVLKAATEFKNLPAKPEDLGADLRAVRKSHPEAAARLEALLKSCNEAAAALLKPAGVTADETVTKSETTQDEIYKRADALVTSGKAKTREIAVAQVLQDHPELYTAYAGEKQGS